MDSLEREFNAHDYLARKHKEKIARLDMYINIVKMIGAFVTGALIAYILFG